MNIEKFDKLEMGVRQLHTALRLFSEGKDLISVITLAGAAEEIFGQLLSEGRGERGLSFRSVLDLLRPGKGRTGAGEGGNWHETDRYVHMDARQEALFLLGRAVDEYEKLAGGMTAEMRRFKEASRDVR